MSESLQGLGRRLLAVEEKLSLAAAHGLWTSGCGKQHTILYIYKLLSIQIDEQVP